MKKSLLLKLFSTALICTLVISGLSGCNSKETEVGRENSNIVFGTTTEPSTLDPHVQSGIASRIIKQNLYRGLLGYQPDNSIGMEIAEDYSVAEDNITYIFKIKNNAKFHDGSDITSDDVKFSIERIIEEKTEASLGDKFRDIISKCEVVNDKTINIILKSPYAPFAELLALPEAAIVSKTYCNTHNNDLSLEAMGNGPYKFVSWTSGKDIKVTAFDKFYKKGKPENSGIDFVFYPDDLSRVSALKAEDVYIIDNVPLQDAKELENLEGFKVNSSESSVSALKLNCKEGPLADYKVRQAISYAIDREKIAGITGEGDVLYGFPSLNGQKYENYFSNNVELAKNLLTEAGYSEGFKLRLVAASTYDFQKQIAEAVKEDLKNVGIDVELEILSWSESNNRLNEEDYDIIIAEISSDMMDMDWYTNYFDSKKSKINKAPGFSDEKIDELLEKGRSTLDTAEREKIYTEVREMLLELSPYIFIEYRNKYFAELNYIEGFESMNTVSGRMLEDTYIIQK